MSKKHLLITTTSFALLAVYLSSGSALAWGPERTTYTNESPADYAVFNSITNNSAVGDERNFVRVGEVGSSKAYEDEIEVVPGKEYEVYIYYHNNAASDTNSTGFGMATNTKISSAYPTELKVGERGMVSGAVSWSYVTPASPNDPKTGNVWDEAYFTTKTDGVVLRYKTGTAIIHNAGKANGSVLSTDLFTEEGTLIGYNKLGGSIPGCAEYSGYITYTLVAESTSATLDKQVSTDGETWAKEVTVAPGDYVTYKVAFNNTGNTDLTNVIFKDTHDEGLTLKTGSVKIYDVNHVDGLVIDDILDLSGYNTGDAAPGALIQIVYQARASEEATYCSKSLKNTISVNYNSTENKTSDAIVKIKCEGTPEEPEPEMNCKTNPEMEGCQELPTTGPLEIIMAVIVAIGIGGAGYYFYRSRKTLKRMETNATGKEESKTKAQADNKSAEPAHKSDKDSSQNN